MRNVFKPAVVILCLTLSLIFFFQNCSQSGTILGTEGQLIEDSTSSDPAEPDLLVPLGSCSGCYAASQIKMDKVNGYAVASIAAVVPLNVAYTINFSLNTDVKTNLDLASLTCKIENLPAAPCSQTFNLPALTKPGYQAFSYVVTEPGGKIHSGKIELGVLDNNLNIKTVAFANRRVFLEPNARAETNQNPMNVWVSNNATCFINGQNYCLGPDTEDCFLVLDKGATVVANGSNINTTLGGSYNRGYIYMAEGSTFIANGCNIGIDLLQMDPQSHFIITRSGFYKENTVEFTKASWNLSTCPFFAEGCSANVFHVN